MFKRRIANRALVSATLLGSIATTLSLGGCLITSGKSIDESGVRVSQKTLRQVEPGKTSEAWLRATLGEPTDVSIVAGQESVRVLKYVHTVNRSDAGTVLFLFAGGSEKREVETTYFETVDGVVTRHWTEGS